MSHYDERFKYNVELDGPIIWHQMQIICSNAIDDVKIKEAINYIRTTANNFFCDECGIHFRKEIERNPPERYSRLKDENGRYVGLAKWIWEMHNKVNVRLGKPIMPWETFVRIYIYPIESTVGSGGICMKGCGK